MLQLMAANRNGIPDFRARRNQIDICHLFSGKPKGDIHGGTYFIEAIFQHAATGNY
jgi:hypothetical protein